jgi:hypothetical protein
MSNSLFHISEFRHNPLMKSHHRREPLDTSSFINCRIMPSFFAPKLLIPNLTPRIKTISGSVIQAQTRLVFPISTSSIFASWRPGVRSQRRFGRLGCYCFSRAGAGQSFTNFTASSTSIAPVRSPRLVRLI